MGIVYDPVSVNAASGTELMMRGLEKRLDLSFSNHFSIGRAIMLFPKDNKTKIYQIVGSLLTRLFMFQNGKSNFINVTINLTKLTNQGSRYCVMQ
jgi:hypothetical protein